MAVGGFSAVVSIFNQGELTLQLLLGEVYREHTAVYEHFFAGP